MRMTEGNLALAAPAGIAGSFLRAGERAGAGGDGGGGRGCGREEAWWWQEEEEEEKEARCSRSRC